MGRMPSAARSSPALVFTLTDGSELRFPMKYQDAFQRGRTEFYGWVPDYEAIDNHPYIVELFRDSDAPDLPPGFAEYFHSAIYEGAQLAGVYERLDWKGDELAQKVLSTIPWRIESQDLINLAGDVEPRYPIASLPDA